MLALLLALVSSSAAAKDAPVHLKIYIIHATKGPKHIDPKVRSMAKAFSKLDFTSYRLKDEAVFELIKGSTGRMQMPNGEWMSIRVQDISAKKKARLILESKKLKFRSTVIIDPGATIAVGGPSFEKGRLIFAVTRTKQ